MVETVFNILVLVGIGYFSGFFVGAYVVFRFFRKNSVDSEN